MSEPKIVSRDGWLQPTTLHFQIIDAQEGHGNMFIYFKDPSEAIRELMNRLCCWGGPSRRHDEDKDAYGYEVHRDVLPAILTIALRTRFDRPKDNPEAMALIGFMLRRCPNSAIEQLLLREVAGQCRRQGFSGLSLASASKGTFMSSHLVCINQLIITLWDQFFCPREGLMAQASQKDPNLGLHVALRFEVNNNGYEKDGNTHHKDWERNYFRVIHVIVTSQKRVYVASVPDDESRQFLEPVERVPVSMFKNTSNHDAGWRTDGMRIFHEEMRKAYEHCYDPVPEEHRAGWNDMNVFTELGGMFGHAKAFNIVRIERTYDPDQDWQGYFDILTKVERVNFSINV